MLVSFAIPCYKSSKTITSVVNEIRKVVLSRKGYDYEIILVNDYPFDTTFDVIRELCRQDKKIIGINLSKNYGQTSAKMAAIGYCSGDILVYLDDDGQHPVNCVFKLIDKINEGYDAVYGYFPNKKHSKFKQVTSKINSKLLEINGTKPKGVHISSFYALSKFAVEAYNEYKSPFPSMGGFLNSIAGKSTDIELPHRERLSGSSNYTLKKLLKLWLTGFTNFSILPLRCLAFLGIIISIIGFVSGIVIIVEKIIMTNISAGYTSIIAVVLFLGGLILMGMGFIGEYIGRIYMTVSNMQQYRIREVINNKTIRKSDKYENCK